MNTDFKKTTIAGVNVDAIASNRFSHVINEESVAFLRILHEKFNDKRLHLLEKRTQTAHDETALHFPADPQSAALRKDNWKIGDIPQDLQQRHVEITGPTSANIIANALKSKANCFMADFEDATSPTWENIVDGQYYLNQAICGTLNYTSESGKNYYINEEMANDPKRTTLICRPRGWHLDEKHLSLNHTVFSASLTDFGLYVFKNVKTLLEKGSGAYFYLPKIQHHSEAALWDSVFTFTEQHLGIKQGCIKATVLIETLPATFHLHEILHALKNHIVGLNCGRWDYIFSAIKCLHHLPHHIYPNRSLIDMSVPFMKAYSKLVVQACHQRGAYAIGGMSANVPIKGDDAANFNIMEKVRKGKIAEIENGHDGTWVAHPGLVGVVQEVYEKHLGRNHQLEITHPAFNPSPEELTACPAGEITLEGVRENINAALIYMESWLNGNGCLAVNHLMEDAATAEISRSQLWQWVRYNAPLNSGSGKNCTIELVQQEIAHAVEKMEKEGNYTKLGLATEILLQFIKEEKISAFMTPLMYEKLA